MFNVSWKYAPKITNRHYRKLDYHYLQKGFLFYWGKLLEKQLLHILFRLGDTQKFDICRKLFTALCQIAEATLWRMQNKNSIISMSSWWFDSKAFLQILCSVKAVGTRLFASMWTEHKIVTFAVNFLWTYSSHTLLSLEQKYVPVWKCTRCL